ncbi:MAG: VOC family protein [Acidobacteriaceae bacterium]|nr:VOC family protein [Acidobacteriaceae bacterium]
MPRRIIWISLLVAVCLVALGQTPPPAAQRPPIVGVAHIGLQVSDLAAADNFYGHVLGFEHFSLDKPTGGLMLNYYKINDHQYVEIYPTLTDLNADRMTHFAFETTNIQQLRDYLAAKGVKVPETLKPGLDKNLSIMIKDPEGHNVEFVQYMPGSLHSSNFGKLMPDTRISEHMNHVGVTIHDRAAADRFYGDILGFQLMWYGGKTDNVADWVDMRVPDGTDWLEYMLNVNNPTPKQLGVQHHFSLGVPSIQPPYKTVLSRGYTPPQPPKIGRDGKWQLNMYDPNDTRVEAMEFKPVQPPCCSPFIQPEQ